MVQLLVPASSPSSTRKGGPTTMIIVSTYPPTRCGIGYYTDDLVRALQTLGVAVDVIAIYKGQKPSGYGPEVIATINAASPSDFQAAANVVAQGGYTACIVQHEFGLYGGNTTPEGYPTGSNLLYLVNALPQSVQLAVMLHTVLDNPGAQRLAVIQALAHRAATMLAMTEHSRELLIGPLYTLANVMVAPHGVPEPPAISRNAAKQAIGVPADQPLVVVSGLMHPLHEAGAAIQALPLIQTQGHPATLHIVGEDHPDVIQADSRHRQTWHELAADLDLIGYVTFVNRELPTGQLMEYFRAADITIARGSPGQAASGRIPRAMAAGSAVAAGPSPYALEVLKDDHGAFFPFTDTPEEEAGAIAKIVCQLLGDPAKLRRIQEQAAQKAAQWLWPHVASRYVSLFQRPLPRP